MTRLPNGNRAIVDAQKLTDYYLSPTHPRGRHKARVFREALGIGQADSDWLRELLRDAARDGEATTVASDAFGTRWQIDILAARHDRSVMIRSIWIILRGEEIPRFVTCWVK